MDTKILLGLLTLSGIFFQGSESASKGNIDKSSDSHVRNKRIIDESPDKDNRVLRQEVPYVVRLLDEDKKVYCTGSILGPRIILTAAHCVVEENGVGITFFISSGSRILKNAKDHTVKNIYVHEGFNWRKKKNDLALVELTEPIDLIHSRHRSINLYEGHLPPNTDGLVTGWGSKARDTFVAPLLPLSINVRIINHAECQHAYGNPMSITPREICTHDVNRTRCCWHADSGGPLVVGGHLVGIFSWFIKRCKPQYPDVFMNLLYPEYNLWVKSWVNRIQSAHH